MVAYPRITLLALLAAVALTVNGCVATQAARPPSPIATATPVFASEEEALAAATEAYAAYLAVSDRVANDGWRDTTTLAQVATGEALAQDLQDAKEFSALGYLQVGMTKFDQMSLQQLEGASTGAVAVRAYLCLAVSGVDVLDSSGKSVVPADRAPRYPLQVEFVQAAGSSASLLLSRSDSWPGKNFC